MAITIVGLEKGNIDLGKKIIILPGMCKNQATIQEDLSGLLQRNLKSEKN
ncbi:MAG: hypothetical protein DHS20C20_31160 [Ardenticatenaceae bacterium]|nr:MAG: hypothetical protein DHS20C20_31160 [Ardenticatenaceae bacterium]